MAAVLMTELEVRRRCMAAGKTCRTSAGCTCRSMTSAPIEAPPDCPPLLTQPGDLSEMAEPIKGWCLICTLAWFFVGATAALVVFFVADLLAHIGKAMSQ